MNALIAQMSAQITALNKEHYALTEKVTADYNRRSWANGKDGITLHGENAIDPADQQRVDDMVRRMRGYIKIRDEELERIGILRDTEI